MKLLTFIYEGRESVGVLSACGEKVHLLPYFGNMRDLIAEGRTTDLMERARPEGIPLTAVKQEAPIPLPERDVICLGINYLDHAEESARFAGKPFKGERSYPVYFSKRVSRMVGQGGEIPWYGELDDCLDYEVELAVIIGKDAYNVKAEDAGRYIFGYSIFNDISARTLQKRHLEWYRGKSLDGYCLMGPWIVTADELDSPAGLGIRSYVNGELRQNSNTDKLIFDVPYIISELSRGMTLHSGTVIATGTPAGVGMGFDPPRFLKPGDRVTCEIDGIGRLENQVQSI